VAGSLSGVCDVTTGQCPCKNLTSSRTCADDVITHWSVDDVIATGQCPCKNLTSSRTCGSCVEGSSDLDAENPFGCSRGNTCMTYDNVLLQEPWDQRLLVSIRPTCLVVRFHLLRSWAKLFSSCSPVLHQMTMSSIHSLHGLPKLPLIRCYFTLRPPNYDSDSDVPGSV